jgi:DNA-binding GntR family transcriptional regulator
MRAAEHAYATVRDGILTGKYHAGSRLTEQDLARAVKVSRTPVREALRRLHAEGLVQFEPNHGAIVSSFGIEAAEEIFELRALLEPLSARLAAERATDDAIAAMRALAEQQVAESTQRKGDFISRIGQLNDLFHRAVQAAAQNMRLGKALAGRNSCAAQISISNWCRLSKNETRKGRTASCERTSLPAVRLICADGNQQFP